MRWAAVLRRETDGCKGVIVFEVVMFSLKAQLLCDDIARVVCQKVHCHFSYVGLRWDNGFDSRRLSGFSHYFMFST